MSDGKPKPLSMQDLADFFKAMVRPVLIVIFGVLVAIMTYEGRFDEIPVVILAFVGLLTLPYGAERVAKRWKEIKRS